MKRGKKSTSRRRTANTPDASESDRVERASQGSPWVLVVVFFFLTGIFLFLRSPYFSVKHYVINGADRVSHEEIIARSTQRSDNIFDLDLDKIQKAIESSPWIKEVGCTVKIPNTLVIDVVERKPIAFAPIGGKMWLIDGQGRVLQEDDGVCENLIAFTGIEGIVAPGQFLDLRYDWGLKVISELGSLAQEKVIEVNVQSAECMLIFNDGCKVFLGEEEPGSEAKVELLESLISELDEEGKIAEYIDLRFDKHAVKLK